MESSNATWSGRKWGAAATRLRPRQPGFRGGSCLPVRWTPLRLMQPGQLDPYAAEVLRNLYGAGLAESDLDPTTLAVLAEFPADKQAEIVTKFAEVDLGSIASKNGFLLGIIKRFRALHAPPLPGAGLGAASSASSASS
eukprot:RCo030370